MIVNEELLRRIKEEYDRRRKSAESRSREAEQFAERDPQYKSAVNGLNRARFDACKAKYENNEAALQEAERRESEYRVLREKAMADLGLSPSDFLPRYHCPVCKDTGWTENGKRCRCFYELAKETTLSALGIGEPELPSFSQSRYENKNGFDKIYPKMLAYAQSLGEGSKNLVISGSVGTGKSFLAGAVARTARERDKNVFFLSAVDFGSVLLQYHLASPEDKGFYLSLLVDCDLLVIDDLGTEPKYKNVTEEYLLLVISQRAAKKRPYIVTTNLSQNGLLDRYGDRVLSRFNEKRNTVFLEIKGEDLRRLKD
ncbi:MAG: ATP-binding protein [Candidatus Borkfalkiaceae bacterium]|nr:ATP-binding protein [Christensenellaceae bacterium]